MAKAPKPQSYNELSEELDKALAWFESDQLDIDLAADKYQETINLINQMQEHLKNAQNKIKKLSKLG